MKYLLSLLFLGLFFVGCSCPCSCPCDKVEPVDGKCPHAVCPCGPDCECGPNCDCPAGA